MKQPKTKIALALLGVAVLAVAIKIITLWETPKPQTITLEVTGTEGRAIEARIEADGSERKLNGTIPAEFTVEAHQLSWEVKRLDGPEEEKFKVAVHTPSQKNWGGSATNYQVLRGGLVGASGLRRSRVWQAGSTNSNVSHKCRLTNKSLHRIAEACSGYTKGSFGTKNSRMVRGGSFQELNS